MNYEKFEPETPTELMLFNEIKKLKRELMIVEHEKGIYPVSVHSNPLEFKNCNLNGNLILPCSFRIREWLDDRGNFVVRMEGKYSDGSFGSEYFIDPHPIRDKHHLADFMLMAHKREMHKIANLIIKEKS